MGNMYSKGMKEENPLLYKYFKEILSYLMTVESASAQEIIDVSGVSYGTWRNSTWKRLRNMGLVVMIPPKTYGYPARFKINPQKYMYVQEILDMYGDRVDLSIDKEVEKIFADAEEPDTKTGN